MALPININNLITGKTVEWDRIEFKAGWNPEDVLHTMCAFANDVNNWGGGYIITGIAEQEGMPVLPPVGLKTNQIDKTQKELVGLTNILDPFYCPVTLFELSTTLPLGDLCRRMRIAVGPSEYLRPVNAGLLFFNPNPDEFFRGAITEVIQFKDDTGTEFTEHIFKGPIHRQIRATLEFLRNNVIAERIIKVRGKAEADRFYNFPYEAAEETLVNAIVMHSCA